MKGGEAKTSVATPKAGTRNGQGLSSASVSVFLILPPSIFLTAPLSTPYSCACIPTCTHRPSGRASKQLTSVVSIVLAFGRSRTPRHSQCAALATPVLGKNRTAHRPNQSFGLAENTFSVSLAHNVQLRRSSRRAYFGGEFGGYVVGGLLYTLACTLGQRSRQTQ